jgi:hypothetical protein
MNDVGILDDDK